MQIVDVLVQSAAAYSLILLIAAIVDLVTSGENPTVSMFAAINYEGVVILSFVSVRGFGVQILGKV